MEGEAGQGDERRRSGKCLFEDSLLASYILEHHLDDLTAFLRNVVRRQHCWLCLPT